METTPLGLTRLSPGEPLSVDGYSFQSLNPKIIDTLLRYAAILHHHDGHAALASPSSPLTAATDAVDGMIGPDQSIYLGYTLTDQYGGETTMIADPLVVTTPPGLQEPDDTPDATWATDLGTLVAATYSYAITVTDGFGGETALGPIVNVTVPVGSPTNHITITGMLAIATAVGGTGYRLWRRVNGGTWGLISDGTIDTIDDDGTLCVDCTVSPPQSTGRTNATNRLRVTIPADWPNTDATEFTIYASLDGSFDSPCLLGTYPVADLGVEKVFTSLTRLEGAPPSASRALPGATRIDALNEIVNLPIGPSVAAVGDLPIGGDPDGALRVVRDANALYVWSETNAAWTEAAGAGGGGGGTATLPSRATLTYNTTLALTGDVDEHDLNMGAAPSVLSAAWQVLALASDTVGVRVRAFPTVNARISEASPLFDVTLAADERRQMIPTLAVFNDDTIPEATLYLRFDAVADGAPTFHITFVPIETGAATGTNGGPVG